MRCKAGFYVSVSILCLLIYITLADASVSEQAKLVASDSNTNDYFGRSVSINGDYAIVGAYGKQGDGPENGAAYIFKREGADWKEQAKLVASDAKSLDLFGASVSISGDYALVGATGTDDKGMDSGSAYIFKRNGETWAKQAKLFASDGVADDRFGDAVSIDGDYAIIGAYGDDDKGTFSGSAYIFKRNDDTWSEQTKLVASDGEENDYFGRYVSISGDYAAVGVYLDDDKGNASGSVYIFKRTPKGWFNPEKWTEQAKLVASDGAFGDCLGCSVSISGDYVIAGAYLDSDEEKKYFGSAYVFKRSGKTWSEQAKLIASDGEAEDYFGQSVSICGDCVVVGAYGDDDKKKYSGSAYLFKRDGEKWSEETKFFASDGDKNDFFGQWVSISGDYMIVGASGNSDKGEYSGSTYIFKCDGAGCGRKGKAEVEIK